MLFVGSDMQCPNGCEMPMRQTRGEQFARTSSGAPLLLANLLVNVCADCGQESLPLQSAQATEAALRSDATHNAHADSRS